MRDVDKLTDFLPTISILMSTGDESILIYSSAQK